MSLQDEIDNRRSEIKTDEYSMSIGELANLYENREIDIHPEFQRYFRWDDFQKTRLIESILLGIPIPPIFVAQQPNGVWDVVDGLQRLSTIFQFIGVLRYEDDSLVAPLALEATKNLPSLKGKTWDSETNSFDPQQRLLIKRARMNLNIILYDSDSRSKFELFQRLNTGGSPLTDQEVRNSIMVATNPDFHRWIRKLSNNQNFRECLPLTERQEAEQFDMELILRFLTFRNLPKSALTSTIIGDLSEFLTDRMLTMAEGHSFDFDEEERAFARTFEILARTTGEDTFKKYDIHKKRFSGQFLITPFEVIAYGIGYNYQLWNDSDLSKIEGKVKGIWSNKAILKNSGTGVRANSRIPILVPAGRTLLKP